MDYNELYVTIEEICQNPLLLEHFGEKEIKSVIQIGTILCQVELDIKKKSYVIALLAFLLKSKLISANDRWALFNFVNRMVFINPVDDCIDQIIQEGFFDIIDSLILGINEISISTNDTKKIPIQDIKEPVVIMTSQMLDDKHSITKFVFNYACIMQDMGIPVVIINESGTSYNNPEYIEQAFSYNYLKEFENIVEVCYEDKVFPFWQLKAPMPDYEQYYGAAKSILSWKPRLVIDIGGECILASLLKDKVKTASIETGGGKLISKADYLVLYGNDNIPNDVNNKKMVRLDSQIEIKTNPFYDTPVDGCNKKRSDYGIPEDVFLCCVVGNRLIEEIDDECIEMINSLLSHTDIWIMFVGKTDERIKNSLINQSRIVNIEFEQNLPALIELADIYVQPKRMGGGTSAFYALYEGVPVITHKFGDALYVVPDTDFVVASYEDMEQKIYKCMNDKDFYFMLSNKAIERGKYLADGKKVVKKILDAMEVAY